MCPQEDSEHAGCVLKLQELQFVSSYTGQIYRDDVSWCTLLRFLPQLPALCDCSENGVGLFCGYSSGWIALPNIVIYVSVEG